MLSILLQSSIFFIDFLPAFLLSVFYLFYNLDSNYKLEISLAENDRNNSRIWSLIDTQSNTRQWQKAQVKINTKKHYRIFIEAYLGNDPKHFIGLILISFIAVLILKNY